MRTLTATIAAALGCILTAHAQVAVSPGYTPYMATVFLATNSTHAKALLEVSSGEDLTLSGDLSGTNATFSGTVDVVTLDADQVTTAHFIATNTALSFAVTTTQPVSATTNWCVPFCGGEYTNAMGLFTLTNNVNLETSTNRGDGGRTFTFLLRNFTGSNVMVGWNTNWINLGSSHPPVTLSNGFSIGVALGAWGPAETQAVIAVKPSIRN
jgi:hypothetical protein